MLGHRVGLFGRQRPVPARIEPGCVYRFHGPDGLVETAQVLAVVSGISGIPHVRYELTIERPAYGRLLEGPKILNLASFAAHFREPVELPVLAAE